jgi:hypothetical protein
MTGEEKVEQIRGLMQSPVWKQVLVPLANARIKANIMKMKDRSQTRRSQTPDDYLAGAWDEAERWISDLVSLVRDWDTQMAIDAQVADDDRTVELAALGRHSPYTSAPLTGPLNDEEQNDGGRG